MKIFGTTEIVTIRLCQYFLGIISLDYQLDLMKVKFQLRLNKQRDFFRSGIDHNILFVYDNNECVNLLNKYGISKCLSSNSVTDKLFIHFTESLRTNGHLV